MNGVERQHLAPETRETGQEEQREEAESPELPAYNAHSGQQEEDIPSSLPETSFDAREKNAWARYTGVKSDHVYGEARTHAA